MFNIKYQPKNNHNDNDNNLHGLHKIDNVFLIKAKVTFTVSI